MFANIAMAVLVSLAAVVGNVAIAGDAALATTAAKSARLTLISIGWSVTQTGAQAWSLDKSGAANTSSRTVTWNLVATQSASNRLVATGRVIVANTGNAPATLGNVVVNLQRKVGGTWTTIARDITDGTSRNAATSAQVIANGAPVTLTESLASGSLRLSTPGRIPAYTTVILQFTASFDNHVLALPTGTPVRAEIIITHGNAGTGNASVADVDIDGSGTIDPDEAWVKSQSDSFVEKRVPAAVPSGDRPVLSDTLADITVTGTVTFTNAVFNLGATSGTVSVSYDDGTDGGTITNCAHLTGSGTNLTACNTQVIEAAPDPCAEPGAPGCGWKKGELLTYNQAEWGDPTGTNAALLQANYSTVYASAFGLLEVGLPGAAGFSLNFTGATPVIAFLPAPGTAGALVMDDLDPISSSAGVFGGDVVALKLNVDFSDAGMLTGSSGLAFGDLTMCGFGNAFDGGKIRDFLASANTVLGGGSVGFSVAELAPIALELNGAFFQSVPSTFAQTHLFRGACPHVWADGEVISYPQTGWGGLPVASPANAAFLLLANYDTIYAPSGVVEIGLPGAAGFSIQYTTRDAVLSYLPSAGPYNSLTADVFNPNATSSGSLGGDVTALRLNIDFADAGTTLGSAGYRFGNLVLCAIPSAPGLEGQTIRQFLGEANTLLGGGASSFSIDVIAPLVDEVNRSFDGGVVSAFARDHVFLGGCP
jgi:hypothetical protein